jgi:hypothetical protein
MIAYALGLIYDDPCVMYDSRKNIRSQNLFILKAPCAAYLCWKKVWQNNDEYQITIKNMSIVIKIQF